MTSDYVSKLYQEAEANPRHRYEMPSRSPFLRGFIMYKFVANFLLCVAIVFLTCLMLSHRSNSPLYPLGNTFTVISLGGLLFVVLLQRRIPYSKDSHLSPVYETASAIRTSIQFLVLLLPASFILKIPVPRLAICLVLVLMPLLLTLQNRLVRRVFLRRSYEPFATDQILVEGIEDTGKEAKQREQRNSFSRQVADDGETGLSRQYAFSKRLLDILLSTILLVLFSPLFILLTLIIRLTSAGPALFVQRRVGRGGKLFWMYKFRSMSSSARRYEASPQRSDDPRITKIGRILRRTSLDELPQLINVFLGEMSLVGPRPEMPFIVRGYNTRQRQRLQVMPGVTGLWQLSRDRAFPIHENIHHDLSYIRNRDLYMDLAILIHTLFFAMQGGI